MKVRVQVVTTGDDGQETTHEVSCLQRHGLTPESLGLSLQDGKAILKGVQQIVVEEQLEEHVRQERRCPDCGRTRRSKGTHGDITLRTVFGKLSVSSPRLHHCTCRPHPTRSFSPLADRLPEHTMPELLFLETKWAALMSYGLTADLIGEVLPMDDPLQAVTIRNHLLEIGQRLEAALGDEHYSYIETCPAQREKLPIPDGPLIVGIDGGYVRAPAKQGCFEIIAGKSIPSFSREEGETTPGAKCFAFVRTHDEKPRRRVYEVLQSQGLQPHQQITFLSDGDEALRDLQFAITPEAEHILDWFHVTMRLTVLTQMAKGLATSVCLDDGSDKGVLVQPQEEALKELERIKWFLWHGNAYQALQLLADVVNEADIVLDQTRDATTRKFVRYTREFETYVSHNRAFIPNYGERYRNGERISTGFVESTVNQVISKRMAKKQQMQWEPLSAHLLLQVRTRVLNDEWESVFRGWYPGFRPEAAAA